MRAHAACVARKRRPTTDDCGERHDDRYQRLIRHEAQESHPARRARPRGGSLVSEGDGVHRRGSCQADHRRRQHLDRDDALQPQPAPSGRVCEAGDSRGGWHADGVQHDRDLRRDHDGHRGDEVVAGQPRADRRFGGAGRARPHVRRGCRPRGLRQDDAGHGDGARPPGCAEHGRLRRHDPPRQFPGQGCHRGGHLRDDRRGRAPGARPTTTSTSWSGSPAPARGPAAGSSPPTRWRPSSR
jgi:hypothetical protein